MDSVNRKRLLREALVIAIEKLEQYEASVGYTSPSSQLASFRQLLKEEFS